MASFSSAMKEMGRVLKRAKQTAGGRVDEMVSGAKKVGGALSDAVVLDVDGKKKTLGDLPGDIRKAKQDLMGKK